MNFRLNWSGGGPRPGGAGPAPRLPPPQNEFSVFVGDLAYEATDEDVRNAFAPHFPSMTSARVMTDSSSGASKGYAFVRFSSLDDARRAVAEMNGALVLGRALRVSEATPRGTGRVAPPQRAPRMVGGGPPPYQQAPPPPGYYNGMGLGAGVPPGPYHMPASGAGGYGGLYGGGGGFGGPPAGPGPAVYYGV